MRTAVVLSLCVALTSAAVFQSTTRKLGSQIAKQIKSGTRQAWLKNVEASRVGGTYSQPVYDFYDDIYLTNITLGTPAQQFEVMPDTGSSNLWVIDAACTTVSCMGQPSSNFVKDRFDTTASSTFQKQKKAFDINYGDAECSGHLGIDVLSFAGLSFATQEFGVADTVSSLIGYQPLDGVFGLAWPSLAVDRVTPPMQNILPQLDAPLFTIWFDRKVDRVASGDSAGLITYGAVDSVNCDVSSINYVPLSAENYWKFPINGFSIGSYSETKKDQAISDTGKSWIGAPQTEFSAIIQQTGAKYDFNDDIYYVPCESMKTLPDLIFTINGNKYNIPSVEYVIDVNLGNDRCAITFFNMGQTSAFEPAWTLGDTFIRTYCNIYDIGNKQIGFAPAIHSL